MLAHCLGPMQRFLGRSNAIGLGGAALAGQDRSICSPISRAAIEIRDRFSGSDSSLKRLQTSGARGWHIVAGGGARAGSEENKKRPSAPHLVFAGIYSGAGVAVGFAALFGLALVPVLLALGHGQLTFDPAIAKIEARGDERVAFNLRLLE